MYIYIHTYTYTYSPLTLGYDEVLRAVSKLAELAAGRSARRALGTRTCREECDRSEYMYPIPNYLRAPQ